MTRTRRVAAAIAAGATTATLVVAGAAPATAATWGHNDARKDVVKATPSDETQFDSARRNRNTDITRFVVRHTKKRVIVRTSLRDLNRDTSLQYLRLKTDDGEYMLQQLLGRRIMAARASKLAPGDQFYLDGPGGEVDCEGARTSANRRKDVARVSLPRTCLGRPAWVRAGAAVVTYDTERDRIFADSAMTKGISDASNEEDVFKLGRRVERG